MNLPGVERTLWPGDWCPKCGNGRLAEDWDGGMKCEGCGHYIPYRPPHSDDSQEADRG